MPSRTRPLPSIAMKTVLLANFGWLAIPAAVQLGPWSVAVVVGAITLFVVGPVLVLRFVRAIGSMNPAKFVDDPVLFAQKSHYSGTRYILARWGVALLPFDELREQAVKRRIDMARAAFLKIKREVEGTLEDVEAYVREQLAKGDDATPAFYL